MPLRVLDHVGAHFIQLLPLIKMSISDIFFCHMTIFIKSHHNGKHYSFKVTSNDCHFRFSNCVNGSTLGIHPKIENCVLQKVLFAFTSFHSS